jgi:hypothetical protein
MEEDMMYKAESDSTITYKEIQKAYTTHNYIIIIIAEHDINLGITNFFSNI